jgi:hypothetical protein
MGNCLHDVPMVCVRQTRSTRPQVQGSIDRSPMQDSKFDDRV